MPAPAHGRIIFSGVFGTASAPYEDWQFGLAFTDPGPSVLMADLENISAAVSLRWNNIAALCAAPARLTNVRAAAMGDDGKTARDPFGQYLHADTAMDSPGTGDTGLKMPTQVSLAISLDTGLDSPVGRGRFYLPAPTTTTLDADGRLSTVRQDFFGSVMQTFLNNINTDLETAKPGCTLAVASAGSPSKGFPPAVRPVTSIRVGRRLDIQRRRGADVEELHESYPLA